MGHFKIPVDVLFLFHSPGCLKIVRRRVLLENIPFTWPCWGCHSHGCALLNGRSLLWTRAVVPEVMDTVSRWHSIFLFCHFGFFFFVIFSIVPNSLPLRGSFCPHVLMYFISVGHDNET